MKKIFLLLLLLCLPVNVLAVGNSMQQKDENLIKGVLNTPVGKISRHHAALKMDYIDYKLNKNDSVYSQLLALENKYSSSGIANKDINLKYIKELKDFYMFLVSYPDKESTNSAFLQEFNERRIVIPDEQYSLLDKDLKVLLSVVNVFD